MLNFVRSLTTTLSQSVKIQINVSWEPYNTECLIRTYGNLCIHNYVKLTCAAWNCPPHGSPTWEEIDKHVCAIDYLGFNRYYRSSIPEALKGDSTMQKAKCGFLIIFISRCVVTVPKFKEREISEMISSDGFYACTAS